MQRGLEVRPRRVSRTEDFAWPPKTCRSPEEEVYAFPSAQQLWEAAFCAALHENRTAALPA